MARIKEPESSALAMARAYRQASYELADEAAQMLESAVNCDDPRQAHRMRAKAAEMERHAKEIERSELQRKHKKADAA